MLPPFPVGHPSFNGSCPAFSAHSLSNGLTRSSGSSEIRSLLQQIAEERLWLSDTTYG